MHSLTRRALRCAVTLGLLFTLAPAVAQVITVDNADPGFSILAGTWSSGAYGTPYGSDYRYALTTDYGAPPAEVEWRPNLPQTGLYQVAIWYVQGTNRADNAPYVIHHAGGNTPVAVNQKVNGETWFDLGSYTFPAGTGAYVRLGNAAHPNVVIADAVRFTWIGTTVDLALAVDPIGGGTTTPTEGASHPYPQYQVVPISAVPAAGYEFDAWTVSVGAGPSAPFSPQTTIIADVNKTVTANFVAADPVQLTMAVNPPGAGATSPAAGGPYWTAANEVVPITADAMEGYRFDHWEVSAGALPENPLTSSTTVRMDTSKTVMAVFAEGSDASFRGFWADAFSAGFKSTDEIDTMVSRAVAGRYNAIVAEVMAYQDNVGGGHGAYWDSAILPKATDIGGGIDPLAYLVQQAHAQGIEVHCWLVAYRVCTSWPPSGNAIMTAHPEWIMVPRAGLGGGPALVDGKYTLDPGSPDVQNYLASIVRELATNYEIDGIHWDYIRYTVTDAGYPSDSTYTQSGLARHQRITGDPNVPTTNNAAWNDFRRRTVTELVRRVMFEVATADNPRQPLRHTAALVTWGDAPTNFSSSSAYGVFQNWREWLEYGYLDAGIPMTYYREHTPPHDQWYRNWVDASIGWRYERQLYTGPGIYLNTYVNSVTQMQYALDAGADGLCTYSYDGTGGDASWYPYVAANLFTDEVATPAMPWREPLLATQGTIYGHVAVGASGTPIDDALILVNGVSSGVRTDANGYYILTRYPAAQFGSVYSIGARRTGYPDVVRPTVLVQRAGFTRANLGLGAWLPGDYNVDGAVDFADFESLVPCLTGADLVPPPGCDVFDLDSDGDADLHDFLIFQTSLTP